MKDILLPQFREFIYRLMKEEVLDESISYEEPEKVAAPITEDGSTTGRWNSAVLLIANYGLSTLAFYGVGVNLVLFLTRVLRQENAEAANNVGRRTGTMYIFSLVGAFLSDSYWGTYLTCAIFQMIFLVGLALLSLSSWLLLVKPSGCGDGNMECRPASSLGSAIFYLSIYLIAIGNGGYQPAVATFGSDQFDEDDPVERHSRAAFFGYFYVAFNAGSILSNTLLVYCEDSGMWVLGFWSSTGSAALALVLFLLGTPGYRRLKPSGSPLTRIAQAFVASICKRATFTDDDPSTSPWRLCTAAQVEVAKCVVKMMPIWLCTVIYSAVFTQMASLFVEQGATMDADVGSFHVPPASMSLFGTLSVLSLTAIYRRVLIPVTQPTELQRMGVGLVLGSLAMVAAGIVEIERLKRVSGPHEPGSLSILWQIPQYSLIGASEAFMHGGQLGFFSGQAPDGVKGVGGSLCMASVSIGSYVSILLVTIVMHINGHMDNFYFLLAILTAVDTVVYMQCAKRYKNSKIEQREEKDSVLVIV